MISKAELSKYRALGDNEADEIIEQIVKQYGISSLRQLMPFFLITKILAFKINLRFSNLF